MVHGASFVVSAALLLGACAPRGTAGVAAAADAALACQAPTVAPAPTVDAPTGPPARPPESTPGPAAREPDVACPPQMVFVEGDYCSEVRQACEVWLDPPSNPFARCAKFAPSVCDGPRVHKRFCVDRDEYVAPGDSLPMGEVSWDDARQVCERQSKRLCKETEWEFACEGEQMLPYPTGYERAAGTCNVDKLDLLDPASGKLRDLRQAPGELDQCRSPFGVRSMIGNVDEWVWRDRTRGEWRSALKGGWWMPARDRCRPATTAHDEHFRDVQTGVRCCADAPAPVEASGVHRTQRT